MKKIVALLLIAALMATTITSCGSNDTAADGDTTTSTATEGGGDSSAGGNNITAPGEFPIAIEPATLSIFMPQEANIEDLENGNAFTDYYQEKTNITLDFEIAPRSAIVETKQLSLSSGDYPDMYFGAGLTREDEVLYGQNGVFVPLQDLIETQSVYLKELMGEFPTIEQQITTIDGNIYSLPVARDTYHVQYPEKMWIYEPWVEAAGMDMPTTTDEFYDFLVYVRDNDVNGNGDPSDEIPLALPKDMSAIGYLIGPFTYFGFNQDGYMLEGDTATPSFTSEEFKDALSWLNMLYEEGLVDLTAFTLDTEQLRQLAENEGAALMGAHVGLTPSSADSHERSQDYKALNPLEGPEGVQLVTWEPYNHINGGFTITSACENPEMAMRWVDWLYTEEGSLLMREGVEGENWFVPEEGVLSYAGLQATWERLTSLQGVTNNMWATFSGPHNMTIHPYLSSGAQTTGGREQILYDASVIYNDYTPEAVLPPLYFGVDDNAEYRTLKTEIDLYRDESIVAFVNGSRDIDTEWEDYLATLDNMGIARYTELIQSSYDSFIANNA